MKRVELLSPAGNPEKMEYAFRYGADAVYLSGKRFGMRAGAGNFSLPDLEYAVDFARKEGKKVYVTLNIFAHNADFAGLDEYTDFLHRLKVDAIIIADYGIFRFVRKHYPDLPVHISTQANVTNYEAAKFWEDAGAKRITLAREILLVDIADIRKRVGLELEVFAHGAMCMAYSGRCLMSNYLTYRDSNKGDCSHICRWEFKLTEVRNEKYELIVTEDERGAYIFNSKDLAVMPVLEELLNTGIDSLKIEGRMKSINYVSRVTKTYRKAIDYFYAEKGLPQEIKESLMAELDNTSNRGFFTGFYEKKPDRTAHNYETSQYKFSSTMVGTVKDAKKKERVAIEARHKFYAGEELYVVAPREEEKKVILHTMYDITGNKIEYANPNQIVLVPYNKNLVIHGLLTRRIKRKEV